VDKIILPKCTIYGGYHQLKLDDDSSKVTAIITHWGVYRFLACPFGTSTEPGKYQERMGHKKIFMKMVLLFYR